MLHTLYEVTRTFSLSKKSLPAIMRFRSKNDLSVGSPAEFYGRLMDGKMLRTTKLVFSHQLSSDEWEIKTADGSIYRIKLVAA